MRCNEALELVRDMMLKGNFRQEGEYCNLLNLSVVSLYGVVMKKMANGTVKILDRLPNV